MTILARLYAHLFPADTASMGTVYDDTAVCRGYIADDGLCRVY